MFFPDNVVSSGKASVGVGEIPYDDKQSLSLVKAYLDISDLNVRKKIINLVSSIVESEAKLNA